MPPIGKIPVAPRFRLERDQLAQSLCQIRFSPVLRISTSPEGVADFQEAIRDKYPRYDRQQGVNIVLGPEGERHETAQEVRHLFRDIEGDHVVTLASDFIALGTGRYVGINDFAERMADLARCVSEQFHPAEMQRLGFRFTNEFRLGNSEPKERMREILSSGFLGASGDSALTEPLVRSNHELELESESSRMIVRHGLHPDGGTTTGPPFEPPASANEPFYLLDMDIFTTNSEEFSPEAVGGLLETFNDSLRSFFAWAVEEKYRTQDLQQKGL